jgi:hypothetical protein
VRRSVTILAALVVLAGLGWLGLDRALAPAGPPSDREMVENFTRHRATFERLVAMIRADAGLERVAPDWTRPADAAAVGVGKERLEAYRALLAEAGIAQGFSADGAREQIEFIAYAGGLGPRGWGKSYVWRHGDRSGRNLVADLDGALARGGPRERSYRPIEGPWYLSLSE